MNTATTAIEGPKRKSSRKTSSRTPANWEIKVRRGSFPIDKEAYYAVPGSKGMSHFMHMISLGFPRGEQFFVDSVLHYRDRIQDEELLRQMKAFAAQESQHSAQHKIYNARVDRGGIRAKAILKGIDRALDFAKRTLPWKTQLAGTAAAEHFTAILADQLLREAAHSEAAHPQHRKLWMWHAAEEIEHKAVAFDVYQAVGGTYRLRIGVMAVMTAGVVAGLPLALAYFMAGDGLLLSAKEWKGFLDYGFGEPGIFRKAFKDYLSWYRRDFHPWGQDNSQLVKAWRATYETETMTPSPV